MTSRCCREALETIHSQEGTSYYICTGCEMATDPIQWENKEIDNGNV